MPLTAAELIEHPAFPDVIWDLKPTTKGKCVVAATRGGPFNIAYEIHGTGPIRIVVSSYISPFNSIDYVQVFFFPLLYIS